MTQSAICRTLALAALLLSAAFSQAYAQLGPWQSTGGPELGSPGVLTVNPITGRVLASPFGGGVFMYDVGAWTYRGAGLTDLYVTALASQSDLSFAGTQYAGVFSWSESTGTWIPMNNGLPSGQIRGLFITYNRTVLAAQSDTALHALTPGATTWTKTGVGFPRVSSAYFFQQNNGRIWASTSEGVCMSTDEGATWESRNGGLPASTLSSGIAVTSTNLLISGSYAQGAFRSSDLGLTWTQIDTVGGPKHIRAVAADLNGVAYIVSTQGMFISTNGGSSFTRVITGARGEAFSTISSWKGTSFIAFSNYGGMWSGASSSGWKEMNNGFSGERVYALRWQPGGALWSGSNYGWLHNLDSYNGDWKRSTSLDGVTSATIDDICITSNGTVLLAAGSSMYRAAQPWTSWTRVLSGSGCVAVFQLNGNAVFSGLAGSIRMSTDDGVTWTVSDTLGTGAYPFAFAKNANGDVLVGISGSKLRRGVRIRESATGAWRQFGTGLDTTDVSALGIALGKPVAGTWGRGIFEYDAQNDAWVEINNGLTNMYINDIVAGPIEMYAATWGDGVFKRYLLGSSWQPMNLGLPNLRVTALETAWTEYLYAGTQGNSVYKIQIPWEVAVEGDVSPDALNISVPSPHPASHITSVQFTVPNAGYSRLEIWNALGRRVAVLHEGDNPAGSREIRWNAEAFPPGMYTLRLIHGRAAVSQRCLVE